ncbi:RCC1 domain-containing protein [Myxococcus fulvus]|uniref:RCC1 domain-containing protein n=1 Tax=Myxococcus fulvus TaxID=33 RepID=UPI003B9AF398
MNRVSRRLAGAVRGLSLLCLCLAGLGGTAHAARPLPKPAQLAEGGSRQGWVLAGRNHSLALRTDGTVWAWGDNTHGQLGHGEFRNQVTPTRVSGMRLTTDFAAGFTHSLAVTPPNGTVWAWGDNSAGQLGNGTTDAQPAPVLVPGLQDVKAVAAGVGASYALKNDGTVWAWGENSSRQLGDGTRVNRRTPVKVLHGAPVVALASGASHALARTADGTVWSWGLGTHGRLGNGAETLSLVPVAWTAPAGSPVVSISAGTDHSVATLADGSVLSWGSAALGQLCQGGSAHRGTPAPIW